MSTCAPPANGTDLDGPLLRPTRANGRSIVRPPAHEHRHGRPRHDGPAERRAPRRGWLPARQTARVVEAQGADVDGAPVPVAGSRARLPAERVGALRRELTGKQRGRVFGYDRHLEVLNEGTTSPLRR